MIDLDSKRKLSYYSNFETRSLNVLELMEGSENKVIQFSLKVLNLAFFDHLGPHSKSIFSTYRRNFETSLVGFLGKVVWNIVLKFELSIFKKVRGG